MKDYQLLLGLVAIAIAIYYGLLEQPISDRTEFDACIEYSKKTTVELPQAWIICSSNK